MYTETGLSYQGIVNKQGKTFECRSITASHLICKSTMNASTIPMLANRNAKYVDVLYCVYCLFFNSIFRQFCYVYRQDISQNICVNRPTQFRLFVYRKTNEILKILLLLPFKIALEEGCLFTVTLVKISRHSRLLRHDVNLHFFKCESQLAVVPLKR